MSKALWAGTLAAIGLWLSFALRSESQAGRGVASPPQPAAPAGADAARVELAQLRQSLARTERRLAELETTRPDAQAQPQLARGQESSPATADSQQFTNQQRQERVAAAFAAERADPSWQPERALGEVMREALPPGSSVRAIDCRSSLCRVETSHPDASSQRTYVSAIVFSQPGRVRPYDGALFDEGEALAGGGLRSVTYFLRPGRELPDAATRP
jgi:hypothetical protein